MKKHFLVSAAVTAAFFVPVFAFAAPVNPNGSFENGTDPGAYTTLNLGDPNITDWSVDSGSVDYIGTYWLASDGARSVDLNGLAQGSISQTFPTSVGTTYTVSFDLSGNPDSRPAEDPLWSPSLKDVRVSATGGSPQDFTFDTAAMGNSLGNMMWQHETYTFTATAANTTLTFASQIPGAFGPALDNVAVTASTPTCGVANSGSFEDFTLGNVNGQQGWGSTGSYDQAVVSNIYGYPTFGCQSLRISDAVTSGSFGDQTFSFSTANEAGETAAVNNGFSGGTRQNHFEAQFDLASTMATLQPGMHLSVSPDRGDGARMSYLRFEDQADGIHVFFDDAVNAGPLPTVTNFTDTDIATLDRGPHTIKFSMDFLDGPGNDVVKIYIDGTLVHTGTSWEDYYRYDPEQTGGGNQVPTVDSLLFRESGGATPADRGNGFLVDNVSLSSSTTPPPAPAMCPDGTVQGNKLETVTVNSQSSTAMSSIASLTNGQPYLMVASGTWQNSNLNAADAEYASTDSWATHMDGYDINPYFLGASEFDLEVNGAFINWGAYNGAHTYNYLYTGTGAPANFLIFDGDSNGGPANINPSWYGDNSGNLSVDIYPCNPPAPATVQVHIFKYVDGVQATALSTNSATFPMETTFSSPNLGDYTNTPFTLSPTGWGAIDGPYEASFVGSQPGANYEADELLNTPLVGAQCDGSHTYALAGYTTGDTLEEAQAATPSLTPPQFTDLQSDHYMIVWNTTCPTTGTISGEKYNDLNRNGKKDPGEPGLAGWTIKLMLDPADTVVATAVTDANGNYTFANVAPGTYDVREVHQKGWKRMSKNPKDIVIVGGSAVTDVDFGNATIHRGEKEDTDKDDNRDDQPGKYYANHGHSDYGQDQNNKDHQQPDNSHGHGNNNH